MTILGVQWMRYFSSVKSLSYGGKNFLAAESTAKDSVRFLDATELSRRKLSMRPADAEELSLIPSAAGSVSGSPPSPSKKSSHTSSSCVWLAAMPLISCFRFN